MKWKWLKLSSHHLGDQGKSAKQTYLEKKSPGMSNSGLINHGSILVGLARSND